MNASAGGWKHEREETKHEIDQTGRQGQEESDLSARTLPRQITEAQIKCTALNRRTLLGMPESIGWPDWTIV
jgi:hypothetical protein